MNRLVVSAHFTLFLALMLTVWALPSGRYVLVVASPDAAADNIFAVIGRAGGSFVGPGRLSWMAVAYSDEDDFPARLMQAGALVVLNHSLAVGCQQGDQK
jgi:hypothetical protein